MISKKYIYGIIGCSFIEFMGFSKSKAIKKAEILQYPVRCFDSKVVMKWRFSSSIKNASTGIIQILPADSEIFRAMDEDAPITSIPDSVLKNNRLIYFTNQQIQLTFLQKEILKREEAKLKSYINKHINKLSEIFDENFTNIMNNIAEHMDFTSKATDDQALEILKKMLEKDPAFAKSGISADDLIKMLIEYVNQNNFIEDIEREKTRQIANAKIDTRDKKFDDMTSKLINRWQTRCKILDDIIENDINGLGNTQMSIAIKNNASLGLVNKISQMYHFNNNITYNDLMEKPRGAKPNPFKKISEDLYIQLCNLFSSKGPVNEGLNHFSWCASAIYYWLKNKGIDVKLNYIYKFCNRLSITSKFAARNNFNENIEDVNFFINEFFPEICKKSILNGEKILFVDECHVLISPRFKGYSLKNSDSICSYDGSLEHSMYSIITFIGLDGFIRVYGIEGSFNSEKFTDILENLKKERKGEKLRIIMDNSPIHTSFESFGWFEQNKKYFKMNFLPKYAPRLNVVEFFNNVFKGELKKNSVMTNEAMIARSKDISKKYNLNSSDIKELIQSLFLKEECSYIKLVYDKVRTKVEQKLIS